MEDAVEEVAGVAETTAAADGARAAWRPTYGEQDEGRDEGGTAARREAPGSSRGARRRDRCLTLVRAEPRRPAPRA
ncbi:hypothetical protein K2224_13340 [Streptomyces sp. BHT-5-2]|uniref:hypothetical protein n=1 Tax=unclassified Streptomyces TaxID=2593676 RepID=UPI001C8CFEE6|nr:hypothetical protein [Streptomyces sp. BHT-5-2]QZL04056.1 hypothetical protein K2224_13340 [Streptomyces sp. BHT-5-2]